MRGAIAREVTAGVPGYKDQGYEIAGFVWWQGHKDTGSPAHASRYEENLGRLIQSLRKDYDAPKATFVLATDGRDGRRFERFTEVREDLPDCVLPFQEAIPGGHRPQRRRTAPRQRRLRPDAMGRIPCSRAASTEIICLAGSSPSAKPS